jgi:NitT/TauT family transport system ATP-binding protein
MIVSIAFANAALDVRRKLFSRHLLSYVPLAAHIRRILDEGSSHVARKSRFLHELEDAMVQEAAEQTLRAIISWARYAEAFACNGEREAFSLENPR